MWRKNKMINTRNAFLHNFQRKVSSKALPVKTEKFQIRNSDGFVEEKKVNYFSIDDTKPVTDPSLLSAIDFYNDYLSPCGYSHLYWNATGCRTWDSKITADQIKSHVSSSSKSTYGYVQDPSVINDYNFIHIDYDVRQNSNIQDLTKMLRKISKGLKSYGAVSFTNFSPDVIKGFHVWVSLNKSMSVQAIDDIVAIVKKQASDDTFVLDKYSPTINGKRGMRVPFDGRRMTLLSDGLFEVADWKEIKKLMKRGSKLKGLLSCGFLVEPKNGVVVKPKKIKEKKVSLPKINIKKEKITKSKSDYAFANKWAEKTKALYMSDTVYAGSNMRCEAFAYVSGFMKLMIMRGDTDCSIVDNCLTSTFVTRIFPDYKEDMILKDIKRCRVQVNNENDAINKISTSQPAYANMMLDFFIDGCDIEYVSGEAEKYLPVPRHVKRLSNILIDLDICAKLNINQDEVPVIATLALTLLFGSKQYSRSHVAAFLRSNGGRSDNNFICQMNKFLEANYVYSRDRSFRSGVASKYYEISSMIDLILDEHEKHGLDLVDVLMVGLEKYVNCLLSGELYWLFDKIKEYHGNL